MDHRFQINLRGMIALLSDHLYSRPEVFLRELLQNAVDAITARRQLAPEFGGTVVMEVTSPRGRPPTLEVRDDGVGLTEDEVHRFLATIGESSKRDELGRKTGDYLGQFGIGLLSCFIVSDEILVLTRSARGGPAMEWRGRADGTYALRHLESELEPGTRVFLTCREGREEFFAPERVRELAARFGGLLPFPVRVVAGRSDVVVNAEPAPWRQSYRSERARREALLRYGKEALGETFLDAIPLKAEAGTVDGVAFVLAHPAALTARQTHRVYLRDMFLGETAEQLLPEWAVFVRAVVNARDLRPTASRESFYQDGTLERAREQLGECLRDYLVDLAGSDESRFGRFLDTHHLALKALAAEDAECYKLFIDFLPFDTSAGRMDIRDLRERGPIRYVANVGEFHQMSKLASAQGITLVNAGYVHEAGLIARLPEAFPDIVVEAVEPGELAEAFEELTLDEQDAVHALLDVAGQVLRPFRCAAQARKFKPEDVPAVWSTNGEGRFRRSLEQAKEVANPLFAGVLGSIESGRGPIQAVSNLCLNFLNPIVTELTRVHDRQTLARCVEVLYVQALLLAQQPLTAPELATMNRGLGGLVSAVARAQGG